MAPLAHFELIQPKLDELATNLKDVFGENHILLRVSATQSDAAYDNIFKNRVATDREQIAALVGYSHHTRLFETILFVSSAVVRRAIGASRRAVYENDLLNFLWAARTLVERFAHINYFITKARSILDSVESISNREYISTLDIDDLVKNSVYGTLTDWNAIAVKNDLTEVDLKTELGKGAKEKFGVHGAKQVLDKIDTLNKKIPGSRSAYEILCEFLHPNVGDIFSCTSEYRNFADRHGVFYIQRKIVATGGHGSEMPTAERAVLDKVFRHLALLCDTYAEDMREGCSFRDALLELLTKQTRDFLRKNRRAIRRRDPCPCASGEAAYRCCGAGLMLGP